LFIFFFAYLISLSVPEAPQGRADVSWSALDYRPGNFPWKLLGKSVKPQCSCIISRPRSDHELYEARGKSLLLGVRKDLT
jgi:hypothetical protein